MKIRLRGQSIRLRLGRSEVAALARGESVTNLTAFGPGRRLACVLRPAGQAIGVGFERDAIDVRVPAAVVYDWATGDAVGIDAVIPVEADEPLRLLIEKDFVCLDAADEADEADNADAFPNPSAVCTPRPVAVISSERA